MAAKTFTGARAVIKIDNKIVAIAENYSFTVSTPHEPIFVLGKLDACELCPLSYEPVPISLSGVRVIKQGPHTHKVLKLQELMAADGVEITISDRQNAADGKVVAGFKGCKSQGYSTGVGAKGSQKVNMNFMGLVAYDEEGDQSESSTANPGF